MEPDAAGSQALTQRDPAHLEVCPVCHQAVLPGYYFCPNCGSKLQTAPLSTSALTQAWIYGFSLILPLICYIFITRWPGITYLKSKDEDARTVGAIACGLLLLSTLVTGYYAYVWTEDAIQSSVAQINTDMSI